MASVRTYRIHDFAQLAGVTVKALRHYDRIGLLKPKRTDSGYRAYSDADLQRLEQIVALKFIGLPLREIKILMEGTAMTLPAALRAQRRAVEEKQKLLTRVLRAIRVAEESIKPGQPADPSVLKTIIEAIDMEDGIELMKRYYNEKGWELRRRYYEEGPSPEWLNLYKDANAMLGADPGSPEAQALGDRWLALSLRAYRGDPDVQTHSPTAWSDRQNWPPAMKQRIADLNLEAVSAFIEKVALSARKKYFTDSAWTRFAELRRQAVENPEIASHAWQTQVDLFRDITQAKHEDPAGEHGRQIAQRWDAMLETESAGDAEIKAALMAAWSDRGNWSATLRWRMEALSMASGETFDAATDFLEKAVAEMDHEYTLRLSERSFGDDVIDADIPALVSVWTEGCGGCRTVARFVDNVAREYAGRVRVGTLEAMSNIDLATKFEIRALPTLLLFKEGRIVDRRVGVVNLPELRQMLRNHL
jgi:DNA-binding transcriptional MerR regulator/thiol-disulfide isomerase/thioredoxin